MSVSVRDLLQAEALIQEIHPQDGKVETPYGDQMTMPDGIPGIPLRHETVKDQVAVPITGDRIATQIIVRETAAPTLSALREVPPGIPERSDQL
jgi:hypothetical protein